jgi:hypothetical protein
MPKVSGILNNSGFNCAIPSVLNEFRELGIQEEDPGAGLVHRYLDLYSQLKEIFQARYGLKGVTFQELYDFISRHTFDDQELILGPVLRELYIDDFNRYNKENHKSKDIQEDGRYEPENYLYLARHLYSKLGIKAEVHVFDPEDGTYDDMTVTNPIKTLDKIDIYFHNDHYELDPLTQELANTNTPSQHNEQLQLAQKLAQTTVPNTPSQKSAKQSVEDFFKDFNGKISAEFEQYRHDALMASSEQNQSGKATPVSIDPANTDEEKDVLFLAGSSEPIKLCKVSNSPLQPAYNPILAFKALYDAYLSSFETDEAEAYRRFMESLPYDEFGFDVPFECQEFLEGVNRNHNVMEAQKKYYGLCERIQQSIEKLTNVVDLDSFKLSVEDSETIDILEDAGKTDWENIGGFIKKCIDSRKEALSLKSAPAIPLPPATTLHLELPNLGGLFNPDAVELPLPDGINTTPGAAIVGILEIIKLFSESCTDYLKELTQDTFEKKYQKFLADTRFENISPEEFKKYPEQVKQIVSHVKNCNDAHQLVVDIKKHIKSLDQPGLESFKSSYRDASKFSKGIQELGSKGYFLDSTHTKIQEIIDSRLAELVLKSTLPAQIQPPPLDPSQHPKLPVLSGPTAKTAQNFFKQELIQQFKLDRITVKSFGTDDFYTLKHNDRAAQATLRSADVKDYDASQPVGKQSEEIQMRICNDVMHMIGNVLAKGGPVHISSNDPFILNFAHAYLTQLHDSDPSITLENVQPPPSSPATEVQKELFQHQISKFLKDFSSYILSWQKTRTEKLEAQKSDLSAHPSFLGSSAHNS